MGFIYLLSLKVLKIFPPLWRKGMLLFIVILLYIIIVIFVVIVVVVVVNLHLKLHPSNLGKYHSSKQMLFRFHWCRVTV